MFSSTRQLARRLILASLEYIADEEIISGQSFTFVEYSTLLLGNAQMEVQLAAFLVNCLELM
jgi:hypothetical protein